MSFVGLILEENECFDFDLFVTGGKPERVVTNLVCHVEHHHEPVTLAVEVSFKVRKKGVAVTFFESSLLPYLCSSCDFGCRVP